LVTLQALILFFREKPVKAHLQNVYAAMAVALLACAAGGYLHLFTNFMIVGIRLFCFLLLFVTQITEYVHTCMHTCMYVMYV